MNLGYGRVLKQESKRQILVRSFPVFGELIYDLFWPPKQITNDDAQNSFVLVNGIPGFGKTNYCQRAIDEQIKRGLGGWVVDASPLQTLTNHTIRRLAEKGWDPTKCFVVDLFSEHGMPAVNLLHQKGIPVSQIVEELVAATALMSNLRSTAGPIQLDISRRSLYCLHATNRPLGQLVMFLSDKAFRERVIRESGLPEMERFFLGKDSYISTLRDNPYESSRNKWSPLMLFPETSKFLNFNGDDGYDIFTGIQQGHWIIWDLSENLVKFEIRQILAQIALYLLKANILRRKRAAELPLVLTVLDEYPQYCSPIIHVSGTRLFRALNVGIIFSCQDLGIFDPESYRAIMSNCSTMVAMQSGHQDAVDMAYQIFIRDSSNYRDWDGTKHYSSGDELAAFTSLILQLAAGQAIARIKPARDAIVLDIPLVVPPHVSDQTTRAFLSDMAKKWYR